MSNKKPIGLSQEEELIWELTQAVKNSGGGGSFNPTVDSIGDITPVNTAIADNDSINTFASKTQGQIDAIKTYQDETLDYLRRVKLAGGRVSDYTLSVIDEFIREGKSVGWWSKLKDCWIPVGDFTASQVFLVKSGGAPVFENFVSSDYNENFGYVLKTNTNKRIRTGLVPNNEGITSTNISFGGVSALDGSTFGSQLSYIIGYIGSGVDDKGPYMSDAFGFGGPVGGSVSRTVAAEQNFGGVRIHTSTPTLTNSFSNGVKCQEFATGASAAQDREVSLFASWRVNGIQYYSIGGISTYFIANSFTDSEAKSVSSALWKLTKRLRQIKSEKRLLCFGDSIMAGANSSGTTTNQSVNTRYTKLLADHLGLNELNVSQGSRRVNTTDAQISGISAYLECLNLGVSNAIVCLGINDARADSNKNSGGTPSIITTLQANLTTILNAFVKSNYNTLCLSVGYANDAGNTACQEAYTLACANAAKSAGVLFIDIYRLFLDTSNPNSLLFDTVHPNAAGHLFIAQACEMVMKLNKLYRRPLITGTTVNAGASYTVDVVMLCATLGAGVQVQFEDIPDGLILQNAFVQANNNVRLTLFNPTGGNIVLPDTYANIFVDKNY